MGPRELYDERYGDIYRALYIDHPQWQAKHDLNLKILRSLRQPRATWLDTCCGQAWHFAQLDGFGGARVGIDISAAQLARARLANPDATFIEADVLAADLGDERFDLVTNFWGAYSYLDDHDRITAFVRRLIAWTAPGGALYLELITPATLAAFNALAFAASADAAVRLRSADGVMWSYRDPGGWHDLTSPPLETFEALLAPWFREVSVRGDVATMQQLVAVDRSAARLGQ